MNLEKIKTMTNLADSGQDDFVTYWANYACLMLYEQGVSQTFISSDNSNGIIASIVTELIDNNGEISNTTRDLIKSLRVGHPHSEDFNV